MGGDQAPVDAEFEAQRKAQIAQLANTGRKQFGGGTKQVGQRGTTWAIVGFRGQLWTNVGCSGLSWDIVSYRGSSWDIEGHRGA